MAGFTRDTFQNLSSSIGASSGSWRYNTVDDLADVFAADYFNDITQIIAKNDTLLIIAADGVCESKFTSATGDAAVTIEQLPPGQPALILYTRYAFAGGSSTATVPLPGALTGDYLVATKEGGVATVAITDTVASTNTATIKFAADPTACNITVLAFRPMTLS